MREKAALPTAASSPRSSRWKGKYLRTYGGFRLIQQTGISCSLGSRAIAFRTRQTRHLKMFFIFKSSGRKPASSPEVWRFIVGPGGPKHKSALDLVEEERLPKKQALVPTRNPLQSCSCMWACSSGGRAPALQARSGTPKTPSFAIGFQCFQQFRGICFSLEVSLEAPITWSFGTVLVQQIFLNRRTNDLRSYENEQRTCGPLDHGAFDEILQFAGVSRPFPACESLHHCGRYRFNLFLHLFCELLHEKTDQ